MAIRFGDKSIPIERVNASAYRIPTEEPESDGTLQWDATILVLVEVAAGGETGIGYSYADRSSVVLIQDKLAGVIQEHDALDVPGAWKALQDAIRNLGRPGIAAMAISAIDVALWDLKARLLGLPLVTLLGQALDGLPVYGSGGFTSMTMEQLGQQLCGWAAEGIGRVKMKVGRDPKADPARVRAARQAIGPDVDLFVDANGAYSRKQALALAEVFAEQGVTWFEEPVSSDDLDGMRLLCDRAPAGIEIASGEYGYDLFYFRRMLEASAVDVLMPDATRCSGLSSFLRVGALCEAFGVPISAHCAPALHLHICCAMTNVRHIEYFYDHARIEQRLFDGATRPVGGVLHPDRSRPSLGLEFKRADAQRFAL
ncbi:enolase C-terminal domain-like protein [soil metagenome]